MTRARQPNDDCGSVAVLFTFIVLIAGTLVTFLVDAGAQIQAANRADPPADRPTPLPRQLLPAPTSPRRAREERSPSPARPPSKSA